MNEVDDRPMADFYQCNLRGHAFGCPAGAGGDHELRPFTLDEKWDLAMDIVVHLPEGDREAADKILQENDIEGAEYISNDDGDRLLLRIFRGDHLGMELDLFYIEVSGHDAMNMAIYSCEKAGEIP